MSNFHHDKKCKNILLGWIDQHICLFQSLSNPLYHESRKIQSNPKHLHHRVVQGCQTQLQKGPKVNSNLRWRAKLGKYLHNGKLKPLRL